MRYQEFEAYMKDLYHQFTEHDAAHHDRLKRYRNIEPESAQFLSMLIGMQQSKRVLEIGTSTGYSTLWLAEALVKTQGQMTTLDIDAERTAQAKQHAQVLRLEQVIDFQVLDACDYLKQCNDIFDFILLDAERDAYVDYWSNLIRLIHAEHGVLVVDNVLSHADQVQDFISMVQQHSGYRASTLNIGAGLMLITPI